MGIIYKATNKINGKVYIGQTWKTLAIRRGYHHRNNKNCMPICRAIKKYGRNSFSWNIVIEVNSQIEMDFFEKYYINFYNSRTSKNGYNIREGGSNGKLSKDTKIKISRAKGGKEFYAKKHGTVIKFDIPSEAEKKLKISKKIISQILNKKKKTIDGWFFSYNKEEKHPTEFFAYHENKVYIYCDQKQASKETKVNRRTLCKYLHDRKKEQIQGWIFSYNKISLKDRKTIKKSLFNQLLFGKSPNDTIKEFKSQTDASKNIKCSKSSINANLKGRIKFIKGWRFCYDKQELV